MKCWLSEDTVNFLSRWQRVSTVLSKIYFLKNIPTNQNNRFTIACNMENHISMTTQLLYVDNLIFHQDLLHNILADCIVLYQNITSWEGRWQFMIQETTSVQDWDSIPKEGNSAPQYLVLYEDTENNTVIAEWEDFPPL